MRLVPATSMSQLVWMSGSSETFMCVKVLYTPVLVYSVYTHTQFAWESMYVHHIYLHSMYVL